MYQQYLNQAKAALDYLSSDELKILLNDDDKLEERVNDVLKGLDQEKEVLIAENRNLAEENVNKEPEIIELKSRISELSEEGKTLCTSIQEKLAELKSKKSDNTPDTALALLQTKAAESEENSEKAATKFQEKEITIDEFLEQFQSTRKEMHLRKLKIEKMIELMRQQPTNNRNGASYPNPNSIPSGLPYSRPAPGYPLPSQFYPSPMSGSGQQYPPGPYGMPMPNQMFHRHF